MDYLDRYGASLGTAANPPDGAVYVRRWSVEPLPTNPNNTLILQVHVMRVGDRGTAGAGPAGRDEGRGTGGHGQDEEVAMNHPSLRMPIEERGFTLVELLIVDGDHADRHRQRCSR